MIISENLSLKNSENKKIRKKSDPINNNLAIIIFQYIIILFGICIIIFLLYLLKLQITTKGEILILNIFDKSIKNINKISDELLKPYIEAQKDFCNNPNKSFIQKYENDVILQDVKFNDLNYQIYNHKSFNVVRYGIQRFGAYEIEESNNALEALKFYSNQKNIASKDIFVLDIGGNIGWYPSLLGRYDYNILSFEAFEKNYYISKKNFCLLNKDKHVVIITKGLGEKEETCEYFVHKGNVGNGMVICDKEKIQSRHLVSAFIKEGEVETTTLSKFLPFLSDKNIGLIKMDVEGHELKILKGGIDIITKYHVPFFILEFADDMIRDVGSDPKELAQLFSENGYKISIKGFLSKEYISVDDLLTKVHGTVYFIHQSMAEKIS